MLRNLVIAIVASTGALLGIGTFFLGRDRARPEAENASVSGQQGSVRSSAGGVPPGPLGTTTITSGQLERGASASGSPNGAPMGSPATQPPGQAQAFEQPAPHTHAMPLQMPMPMPLSPPPAQVRGAPAPTPMAAPPQAAAPPATQSPIMGVSPMGLPPHMAGAPSFPAAQQQQQQQQQAPQRAPAQGQAGRFAEPSPFNAGALSPAMDAGAGPFATDPSQAPR